MKNPSYLIKKVLCSVIVFCMVITSCATLPQVDPGEMAEKAAIQAALPLLGSALEATLPVTPASRSVYPLVDKPPGAPFQIKLDRIGKISREKDGSLSFSAGDYWIPVVGYCLKSNASSPDGHLYRLAKLQGSRSLILRDLHSRTTRTNHTTSEIQYASWALQAGLSFEQMEPKIQRTLKSVVPEHLDKIRESAFAKIEAKWNSIANKSGGYIPSLKNASDTLLDSLGTTGDRLRETRELYNSILNSHANYQTLRDSISIGSRSSIEGTETTTPWSQLSEGVYARFITLSHYERPGVLQIRALKAGSLHPAELAADPDDKKIQPLGLAAVPIPLVAPHPLLLMAILAYAAAETAKNVDWNAVGKVLKDLESFANEISEDGKKLIDEMRHRWDKQRQSGLYRPPPKPGPNPDVYPGLEHAKPVGGRPRWRDGDGNIYEWDGRHGEIEKYDRQGRNHKGGFDPETGELRSPPDPRKRVPK